MASAICNFLERVLMGDKYNTTLEIFVLLVLW